MGRQKVERKEAGEIFSLVLYRFTHSLFCGVCVIKTIRINEEV
jgi:hypothetical protein